MMHTDTPLFRAKTWLADAENTGMRNPNAAFLSTLNLDGYPDGRIVLVKDITDLGFTFYTNSQSAKGQALKASAKASLAFYWEALGRQIRVVGDVSVLSDVVSDAYFALRPRDSQLGSWASLQSQVLPSLEDLDLRFAHFKTLYAGKPVPRPSHWQGYGLSPKSIEFWTEKPFRLHHRERYTLINGEWTSVCLYP